MSRILSYIKIWLVKVFRKLLLSAFPEVRILQESSGNYYVLHSYANESIISNKAKLYPVFRISQSEIGDYSYISRNCEINHTKIGKFCGIGPNFFCGWGVHPINGISTSPMFYSTKRQNGITLSKVDKATEKEISIRIYRL